MTRTVSAQDVNSASAGWVINRFRNETQVDDVTLVALVVLNDEFKVVLST